MNLVFSDSSPIHDTCEQFDDLFNLGDLKSAEDGQFEVATPTTNVGMQ